MFYYLLMQEKLGLKDLYFSILIFITSIAITLALSFYFKSIVNNWLKSQLETETKGITRIVNNELNNYKLNYYGIASMAKEVYKYDRDTLTTDKYIADAFGRTHHVAMVSANAENPYSILIGNRYNSDEFTEGFSKEIETENFKNNLIYAFEIDAPVFYTSSGSFKQNYVAAIIPLSKESKVFFYINISYDDLLLPATKAGLLDSNAKVLINIKDGEKIVFASTDKETSTQAIKKRKIDDPFVEVIALTKGNIILNYYELREPSLNNVLRQMPFLITIAGAVMSLLAFGLILATVTAMKYKSKIG